MKKYKLIFHSFLLLPVIISITLYSQDFKRSPLITIPGDNKNFRTASPSILYDVHNSYICWENKLGSFYTIYLKKIDPLSENIYIVWSDTNQNTNPQIANYNIINDHVRIVWQTFINNHWSLYFREFNEGTLSDAIVLTDTSKNNTNPTLSNESLCWIQEGRLLYSKVLSNGKILDSVMIVDSSNCSNPKIFPYEDQYDPTILYEKGNSPNTQIFIARYVGQIREQKPYWELSQISRSIQNINPSFGTEFDISYQTKEDTVWRIIYPDFHSQQPVRTKNILCNDEHPMTFRYSILARGSASPLLGFFLTFDSDSLYNNKEIFISYRRLGSYNDTLINISNSSGDDSKPTVVYLNNITTDSSKVAIIWEHKENDKTDIWWATSSFHLPPSDVKNNVKMNYNFSLFQNYPNPFNPSTVISYQLPDVGTRYIVSLKVYDILGREVATLFDGMKETGNYSVTFYGSGLSSGIYFVRFTAQPADGSIPFVKTMKMLLTK
jgi:hypothetical protein